MRKSDQAQRMCGPAVMVHGGAGRGHSELAAAQAEGCEQAAAAAWAVLAARGSALDAVTAAVVLLENHPLFNAGVGSCLTSAGTVEMDASIMDGHGLKAGAVGAVSTVVNPICLARTIMEDGRHLLFAGAGAEAFAREKGLPTAPPEYFITPRQRRRWQESIATCGPSTVGAVAIDGAGHVAAATSTGGRMHKLCGRIGDSAIIGAGTYADDSAGAASATGNGEAIILTGLARAGVDRLRDGTHPAAVARQVLDLLAARQAEGGLILVDRFGRLGAAHNAEHMATAARGA